VGQRSHGRQGRRDLAGAAATALAQELPRPAIREYLSAEQLAKVTPWSISAIEKMVSRGILKRDVHCPGNHGSAGKRLSGHTRSANRSLRQALVESARGAVRKRQLLSRRPVPPARQAARRQEGHRRRRPQHPRDRVSRAPRQPVIPRAGRRLLRSPQHGPPHALSHQAPGRSWLHGDPRQARGLNHPFRSICPRCRVDESRRVRQFPGAGAPRGRAMTTVLPVNARSTS
jgi:hypothetical protein